MKVVFRVDSSYQMGAGHVMRCLVLAKHLKHSGAQVEFICRPHKGNSIHKLVSSGFKVYELAEPEDQSAAESLQYSQWLGAKQETDADECARFIRLEKVNWVVVDHYGIDERWHSKIKPDCEQLMVIDDLADRKFNCSLLLNQNIGFENKHYDDRVPENCTLLLGTKYALLRPEFSNLRGEAIAKRNSTQSISRILISMGGSDVDNITHSILEILPDDYHVTAVLGKNSPHNEMLISYVTGKNRKLIIDSNNMAELMLDADLAIGAGGSTSWERCCLGLPALVFVVDENQQKIGNQLVSRGAAKIVDNVENLMSKLEEISDDIRSWSLMSESARYICDGRGAERVREYVK